MELKKLKKIEILSQTIYIKWDKNKYNASFDLSVPEIVIGIKDTETSAIFGNLVHEIMEIIHVLTCTRYTDQGTMADFKFFLTHKEFQTNMDIFTSIISQFIK